MKDYNIFDRWVDSHNVSDHTYELAEALGAAFMAMRELLTPEARARVLAALRDLDAEAWRHGYDILDRLELTVGREPADFLLESLGELDNLNFEFGAFAHCLYCYASSGMVEPAGLTTSQAEQSLWITDWIARGAKLIAAIPVQLHPLDFFRLIVTGAEGRWALDHEQRISAGQLASLSALAREPGASATAAYERIHKTVQNLVSEARSASAERAILEVHADRAISAKSAIAWLRAQEPDYFPSSWLVPEPSEAPVEETSAFVLVPVAHAYLNVDEKPFTPDAICESGYEIGRNLEVVADYWAALERLSFMTEPRFRHPQASPHLGALACQDRWLRVPQLEIERQLLSLTAKDETLEGDTERYAALVATDSRFRPHPKGHSRKLMRFETVRGGRALAIEKRKGAPVVYISRRDAEGGDQVMALGRVIGSAPTGRNSNLNTIDSFKNEELIAIRPKDEIELGVVLDQLASKGGHH